MGLLQEIEQSHNHTSKKCDLFFYQKFIEFDQLDLKESRGQRGGRRKGNHHVDLKKSLNSVFVGLRDYISIAQAV